MSLRLLSATRIARLGEQFDALFVESALGLDCDSQHFFCRFWHTARGISTKKAHPQEVSFVYTFVKLMVPFTCTYPSYPFGKW